MEFFPVLNGTIGVAEKILYYNKPLGKRKK